MAALGRSRCAARRRGAPFQPLLHPASRRAAGRLARQPILAGRGAGALRDAPARPHDGDRHRPRPRPRRRLSQPHPAPLPQARPDPQGRLAGRCPAELLVADRARAKSLCDPLEDADQAAGRCDARPAEPAGAGKAGRGDARGRDDDRARADDRERDRPAATEDPATSAGWSPGTPSFMRRNTAGAKTSRASARRSSPTSSASTIRNANAAGLPRWTARMSAASFWSRIPRRSRGYACCWSIRRRADAGLAPS